MRIELNPYRLGQSDRFRLLAGSYFLKNGFLYAILGGLWLYFLVSRSMRHERWEMVDLALLLIIPAIPAVYLWRFWKTAKPKPGEPDSGMTRAVFDDEGLHLASEAGEETVPWDTVTKKEKRGGFLMVHVSRFRFLAIPVSAFPSEDAVREVLSFKAAAAPAAKS